MKILKRVFSLQTIGFWILAIILALFLSGNWLIPIEKKQTFRVFQFDSSDYQKASYACETIAALTAFPNPNFEADTNSFVTVDTEISTNGSKLSIEVTGDIAKVITDTAVSSGIAEGDEFKVLKNDSENLGVGYQSEGLANNWGINLISINKKTGLGIWTKTKLRDDFFGNPSGQVYYLKCL